MDSNNMANLNGVVKKTKGRKKIEMKKISNERNLRVTFSKRRSGIFKKASELTTLCGVDLAVIMFSPSNRVFSFGSPNVDSIIQRYMAQGPPLFPNLNLNEANLDERELQAHLSNLSDQIAAEKDHAKNLNRLCKAVENHFLWFAPIETLNKEQLNAYKKMLEELKAQVDEKRKKLLFENIFTCSSSTKFFTDGSSSSGVNNTETLFPSSLAQNNQGMINGSVLHHH